MKSINEISKDYQLIDKQQEKILGGQALYTSNMKETYVGLNGDACWDRDNGIYDNMQTW